MRFVNVRLLNYEVNPYGFFDGNRYFCSLGRPFFTTFIKKIICLLQYSSPIAQWQSAGLTTPWVWVRTWTTNREWTAK